MFSPTVLSLLRLLSAHPGGVSREELYRVLCDTKEYQQTPRQVLTVPDEAHKVLDRLLEAGVIAERDGIVVSLPGLPPLAQKMERLAARLNRQAQASDQAMELVKVLFRGP